MPTFMGVTEFVLGWRRHRKAASRAMAISSPCRRPAAPGTAPPRTSRLQFIGTRTIETTGKAARAAEISAFAEDFIDGKLYLVYYVDGSRADAKKAADIATNGGYAVVHRLPGIGDWRMRAFYIGYCYSYVQAELLSIAEAMSMAVSYLESHGIEGAVVQTFTGSQQAMFELGQPIPDGSYTGRFGYDHIRPIMVEIAKLSKRLQLGKSRLELHWIKGSTDRRHCHAEDLSMKAGELSVRRIAERGPATRDLDETVMAVTEMHLERRLADRCYWDHDIFQRELIDRVKELRGKASERALPLLL